MSQDDQLHQYGYDHYLKAPKRARVKPQGYRGGKTSILRSFQSPTLATVILLAAAVLFVTVVFATYPNGQSNINNIPIVKADLSPVKEAPSDVGGMSIPNKKSTILARANKPSIQDEQNRIENLLARKKEEAPMSREDAIKSTQAAGLVIPESTELVSVMEEEQGEEMSSGIDDVVGDLALSENESTQDAEEEVVADIKPLVEEQPKASEILQKIGSSKADEEDAATDEFSQKVASAAIRSKPSYTKPVAQAKADKKPETIDYVRSVLNKDETVQNIEPAAGAATSAKQLQAGSYFVQLASITDPARAAGEWKKMQNKYGVLSVSKFRIQEASLSNGKFYRIQAGPMSKADANRICNALKQAKKPGGCLVVQ